MRTPIETALYMIQHYGRYNAVDHAIDAAFTYDFETFGRTYWMCIAHLITKGLAE